MREFNYSLLSDVRWDNEIVSLIAQIHEYKGRQELYLRQKPVELERLVELAKIQSTESSNKIEGIVTTSVRIKELIAEKTTPKNRDEKEIVGYRDVLSLIHERYEYIPITSSVILQLHRDLYKYAGRTIGGKFKNTQNHISAKTGDGKEYVLFTPLKPYETPGAIESICENYNRAVDTGIVDVLLLIPVFIKDFLCIHPFNDGNGRMSRLLTTLLLYQSGYVVGRYISLEHIIEKTKETYYDVLQDTSEGWHEGENDYSAFVKYLLGIVLAAYKDFEDRVNLFSEKLSSYDLVKRAATKKIGDFTKSEILELCPGIRSSSVEAALKKLVEEGYLTRTGQARSTRYALAKESPKEKKKRPKK
ncbi:MAG: Fic family protein [Lachnospiraceae bacterium]|nr:Fic family protein [Lachnospiraceae bacterium]